MNANGLISVMLFESSDSLFRNFKLAKAGKEISQLNFHTNLDLLNANESTVSSSFPRGVGSHTEEAFLLPAQ